MRPLSALVASALVLGCDDSSTPASAPSDAGVGDAAPRDQEDSGDDGGSGPPGPGPGPGVRTGSSEPPAEPVPSSEVTCDWFVVESETRDDRYYLMVQFEGEDLYLSNVAADAQSSYSATLGSQKTNWQLVGMDRGKLPE